MASTQIQTVSRGGNVHAVARAGTRLWAVIVGGTTVGSDDGLNLYYSDNNGGSWTKHAELDSATSDLTADIDIRTVGGVTWLVVCWAGGNIGSIPLKFNYINSNVASGTPAAPQVTPTTVEAGGTNVGVMFPHICISPTTTRPRIWIIGQDDLNEIQAWYAETATPTSWSSTNFTNLEVTFSANFGTLTAVVYWTVGGADKVTMIFPDNTPSPDTYKAVTFDPTAATPTPGSATSFHSGDMSTEAVGGPLMVANAKADYLVCALHDSATPGQVDVFKTVNGTTWTNPSGWTNLAMGHMDIAFDGTDFWMIHGLTFATAGGGTPVALRYRKITTSSDNMGGVTAFSDTNALPIVVPRDTGNSNLYAVYRGTTTAPFTVRSDFVSIGGAADTTPPGSAALTAVAHIAGSRIDLSGTMPADADVAEFELRFSTTAYPAANRSDGTVIDGPTATTANAAYSKSHTGLTDGVRYFYRLFVKDVTGNWNSGTTASTVSADQPTPSVVYDSAGGTFQDGEPNPILEYQLNASWFEAAVNAHFRLRIGSDNVTPPSVSFRDLVSTAGGGIFKYETTVGSGTWTDVPVSGLISSLWNRKLRVYSDIQSNSYYSLQIEQ